MSTTHEKQAVAAGDAAAGAHGEPGHDGHGHGSVAVEPDRIPTRMLSVWIVVTSLFVIGLVVGVVQLFDRWGARELDEKLASEPTQLYDLRTADEARLGEIENAISRLVADPTLLGPLALPGDEAGTGTGTGEPAGTQGAITPTVPPNVGTVAEAAAAIPTGLASEGTGQAAEGTGAEGTGQDFAALPTTANPSEGTGQAVRPEGTGEAAAGEGTGETAVGEGTGEVAQGAAMGTGDGTGDGTGSGTGEGTGL